MDELKQATQRKSSIVATFKAVLWSFFGVRRRSDYEKDVNQLNPLHVIIAGIIGAICFISILIFIVKQVVAK